MQISEKLSETKGALPGAIWIEVDSSEAVAHFVLKNGFEDFKFVFEKSEKRLIFWEMPSLIEEDFDHVAEDDGRWITTSLLEMPAVQQFRKCLGELKLLRVYFLLEGHCIEWKTHSSWWSAFEKALNVALSEYKNAEDHEAVARRTRYKAETDKNIEVLRTVLPTDQEFISLACERRPRITAMRRRADEILETHRGGGSVSGLEDRVLREIAQTLREMHRSRRQT